MTSTGKLLGIDFGERRIGIAVSDLTQTISSGYLTLDTKKNKDIFGTLRNIIQEQTITGIIVGYPERTDGLPGAKEKVVDQFIRDLQAICALPIHKQDESYSTVRATELLRTRSRRQKQKEGKGIIDKIAASIILQDYLNQKRESI